MGRLLTTFPKVILGTQISIDLFSEAHFIHIYLKTFDWCGHFLDEGPPRADRTDILI